ncbi:YjbQ family protein [Bacillus sp. FJAT-42376]|uniref:secondary thiamine-phosphate synthase enzyme YjbQ n=1 Tax=Bacillus sp. FJAT-42376 TaxID=2014076 RepID=UPI000F512B55|nr:secondary thiamine-phosphate synthase enzyme YjbQ [Bacillus sp. FJAT-42376]AZB44192.1 YjbQ family protein [Bacillus sp. FJAT-42376]
MIKHSIQTAKHDEFKDITELVQREVTNSGIETGFVFVYCPHTTAGITINENADPDVRRDMIERLRQVYPWEMDSDRHMEGNTAAHLKASTVGASEQILIEDGQLVLGRWQGIYFCEFDGPRTREVIVKIRGD